MSSKNAETQLKAFVAVRNAVLTIYVYGGSSPRDRKTPIPSLHLIVNETHHNPRYAERERSWVESVSQ